MASPLEEQNYVGEPGTLVRPNHFTFHKVDEGFVDYFVTAGGGVITCKVPVA